MAGPRAAIVMSPWSVPRAMARELGALFRRSLHVASPVFLVYYVLADDLWIGFPKPLLAVLLWGVTLVIEALRLTLHVDIVGIREYERGQISAYFWGGTALLLGLLFFPAPFVVVAMFGMAWVDPLCAWSRERRLYPHVPLLAYGALATVGLVLLADRGPLGTLLLALAATGLALAAEYPTIRYVDDDFTMLMVPMVGMTLLAALLQNL